MTEITVCMPIYNGEKFLDRSIGSILSQTLQDFRILVYDDGSTDGTVQKIESFGDPRIRLVKGGSNCGVLHSRSMMIPMIGTEYCMWLDDDDFFCRDDALERALAVAKSKDFDVVTFARMKWIYTDGRTKTFNAMKSDFEYFGDEFLERCFPLDQSRCLTTKIIRTGLLQKCVPEESVFSKRFASDDTFFMCVLPIFVKRYCHLSSEEPIYAYNCDIGVWGSKRDDYSPRRFDDWCYCVSNVIKSAYKRMTAIRGLSETEAVNMIGVSCLTNLLERISEVRKTQGDAPALVLARIFNQYFGMDGVHVVNGFDDLAMPSFVNLVRQRIEH